MTVTAPAITVRLAQPHEGKLVERLVIQGGGATYPWMDWSDVFPYWIIGEVNGEARGVIMAGPGKPFGRLEYLCLDPSLPKKQKAVLARDLSYAGVASLKAMGSQASLSHIDHTDEAWERIAQKRGWVSTGFGTFLLKRII